MTVIPSAVIGKYINTQIATLRKALDEIQLLAGDECQSEIEIMRKVTNEMVELVAQLDLIQL